MISIVYGTRPEIIKLFPIINLLKLEGIGFKKIFTGQHPDLVKDVEYLIGGHDIVLKIDRNRTLNELTSFIIKEIPKYIEGSTCVIIQGDTSTCLSVAISSFNMNIPIVHIEAGLRTYDLCSPFPEEGNRQLISKISSFNFVPTILSYNNLLKENIDINTVYLVGNTIIDSCKHFNFISSYTNKILITLHRRENFEQIENILNQINNIAKDNLDLQFIYIKHPNPNVLNNLNILNSSNINIIDPLKYEDMLYLLSSVKFIISDSGGIQEEATAFNKRILIVRNNTERPEVIDSGFGLIGLPNLIESFKTINNNYTINKNSPFGDGTTSYKIIEVLKNKLKIC